MDANASFRMSSSNGYEKYALRLPFILPDDVQIDVVSYPINNHPGWTADPYAGVGVPDTFNTHITLPNPLKEPAFYAAAVDCIRMANYYFELVGRYSKGPLTEAHVRHMVQQWPSTVNQDGQRVRLSPVHEYPTPPDGRILFVKEAMGDPTDPMGFVLWIKACRVVTNMSNEEWRACLGCSCDQLVESANNRIGNDGSWLILELFKRYLVWRELAEGLSVRARNFADYQPSAADLEAFFNQKDVKEKGATLVDICHAFPHARQAQMPSHRIFHFATLTPQLSVRTALGVNDPVESRFFRKAEVTDLAIRAVISRLLQSNGAFVTFSELAAQYFPSISNRRLIADTLNTMTTTDLTTGHLIPPNAVPSPEEIDSGM